MRCQDSYLNKLWHVSPTPPPQSCLRWNFHIFFQPSELVKMEILIYSTEYTLLAHTVGGGKPSLVVMLLRNSVYIAFYSLQITFHIVAHHNNSVRQVLPHLYMKGPRLSLSNLPKSQNRELVSYAIQVTWLQVLSRRAGPLWIQWRRDYGCLDGMGRTHRERRLCSNFSKRRWKESILGGGKILTVDAGSAGHDHVRAKVPYMSLRIICSEEMADSES